MTPLPCKSKAARLTVLTGYVAQAQVTDERKGHTKSLRLFTKFTQLSKSHCRCLAPSRFLK